MASESPAIGAPEFDQTDMPRPKTRTELLEISERNLQALLALIDSYGPEQRLRRFPPGTMNRCVADVLAHLHEWHLMMLGWYEVGSAGEKPVMPAPGYTWKTSPALNRALWEKNKEASLSSVRKDVEESYQRIREIISRHTNKELFTKQYYPWTGSTSLGSYLVSATSSHYDWALKLIKKGLKNVA